MVYQHLEGFEGTVNMIFNQLVLTLYTAGKLREDLTI